MITAKQQAETDQAIMEACKKLFFTTAIPEMCKTEGTPKQIEYLKDALLRELARREENKKARLIKRAHFPVYKAFEGYSYKQVQLPPALTKEELENVSFINQKQNLVLYGPVGVGKTHMAIAAGTGKAKLILIGSSVGRILFGFRQNVIQNQNISFFQRKVHEFRTGNRQQLHVIAAGGTGNMGISLDIGIASAFGTIIYR